MNIAENIVESIMVIKIVNIATNLPAIITANIATNLTAIKAANTNRASPANEDCQIGISKSRWGTNLELN